MSNYITATDLNTRFGIDRITMLSNVNDLGEGVNTTRTTAAINYAETVIDNAFRFSRYVVPLATSGTTLYTVKEWALQLAYAWLLEARSDPFNPDSDVSAKIKEIREDVMKQIRACVSGQESLDAEYETGEPDAPVMV